MKKMCKSRKIWLNFLQPQHFPHATFSALKVGFNYPTSRKKFPQNLLADIIVQSFTFFDIK